MTKRHGEEVNTSVMKLVKTDAELASEAKSLAQALVGKIAEMRSRDLIVSIGMDNGAETKIVKLTVFKVDKTIENFSDPVAQPQR